MQLNCPHTVRPRQFYVADDSDSDSPRSSRPSSPRSPGSSTEVRSFSLGEVLLFVAKEVAQQTAAAVARAAQRLWAWLNQPW